MIDNSKSRDAEIIELLAALERGEDSAMERLTEAIYPELKSLAHFHLLNERPGHTLNTTAIVHEAFIRLAGSNRNWSSRKHFMHAAARVMRHLLVDHARQRNAEKRGGGVIPELFCDDGFGLEDDSLAVLALDRAIRDIAELDPRLEQVIECRYFAGLTVAETAETLGMAVRTVERDLQRAMGYIMNALQADRP